MIKSTLIAVTVLAGSIGLLGACRQNEVTVGAGLPYQSSFQRDPDGWVSGITDYGPDQQEIMQFQSGWKALPAPLDTTRKSLMLSSMNRSDDAFMFVKKKVTGLQPNTKYKLIFTVELASKYPEQSVGIGGSPGGSVFLKAGATPVEPASLLKDGYYSLNVDKGEQGNDGRDAVLLGTIGNREGSEIYTLINRSNAGNPFVATSNDNGELWLLVGTDSGFEGLTTLYYSRIDVRVQ